MNKTQLVLAFALTNAAIPSVYASDISEIRNTAATMAVITETAGSRGETSKNIIAVDTVGECIDAQNASMLSASMHPNWSQIATLAFCYEGMGQNKNHYARECHFENGKEKNISCSQPAYKVLEINHI